MYRCTKCRAISKRWIFRQHARTFHSNSPEKTCFPRKRRIDRKKQVLVVFILLLNLPFSIRWNEHSFLLRERQKETERAQLGNTVSQRINLDREKKKNACPTLTIKSEFGFWELNFVRHLTTVAASRFQADPRTERNCSTYAESHLK